MNKYNSLGVAMIVKNAAGTVERAIRSVSPLVKQIVVVDTGSEDNTAAICTRLGAEVFFKKWSDDFSASRNYALSFMRTD